MARVYRSFDTTSLLRDEAIPARVLAEIGNADIVHLALHYLQDPDNSSLAQLVLTPAGNDSGGLTARAISPYPLNTTAHRAVSGRPHDKEKDAWSVGGAFLAAGVPAVVGSLSMVDGLST